MVEKLTDEELVALAVRYPLPDGVDDVIMTREILADAMAVAVPTISDWIGKGMPVRTMGGIGRAYELQLAHCWAWRQSQKADQDLQSEKMRRSVAAMRLALIGGKSGDTIEALDPKTRREIMAAQIEYERFQRERNQLLQRADVAQTFEQLFGVIRNALLYGPDRLEAHGNIPPSAVEGAQVIFDEILDTLRRDIEKFWADRPVKTDHDHSKTLFDQ